MWVDGVVQKHARIVLKPYCDFCLRIFWSVLENIIKWTILMLTSMLMMMMVMKEMKMLNLTEPKMREPTEHPGPIGGSLSPVLSALSSLLSGSGHWWSWWWFCCFLQSYWVFHGGQRWSTIIITNGLTKVSKAAFKSSLVTSRSNQCPYKNSIFFPAWPCRVLTDNIWSYLIISDHVIMSLYISSSYQITWIISRNSSSVKEREFVSSKVDRAYAYYDHYYDYSASAYD